MNREIKFRAWFEPERIMKYMDDEIHISTFLGKYVSTNSKLMLYTGLKDKNDKEIYEADKILIKQPHRSREWKGEVIWDDYEFTGKGFYFPHFDVPNSLFSEGTEYIEVIGNIYEDKIGIALALFIQAIENYNRSDR